MDDQALRPNRPNNKLAEILEKLSKPDYLKGQIQYFGDSQLPEPLKSASELIFSAQWVESRFKNLATTLSNILYEEHVTLKIADGFTVDHISSFTNGKLVEYLNRFEIKSPELDKEYKKLVNDFCNFSKKRNKYVHHYFNNLNDFESVESELKQCIKEFKDLDNRLDAMLDIWWQASMDRDLSWD